MRLIRKVTKNGKSKGKVEKTKMRINKKKNKRK